MGISNVVALKQVLAEHQTAPLDDVVQAINIKLALSVKADNESGSRRNKAENLRLDAARMLVDLRRRVEEQQLDWWKWQNGKFTRSRKDVEKLMRMAKAADPEAAAQQERSQTQERMTRARSNGAHSTDVRSITEPQSPESIAAPTNSDPLVESALALVRKMTVPQRHEFMAKLKEEFT